MAVFLYGNTGTFNRGCEAIVRASKKLLGYRATHLCTSNPAEDRSLCRDIGLQMVSFKPFSRIQNYKFAAVRKITGEFTTGFETAGKPVTDIITSDDLCLMIGGDTYCYRPPYYHMGMNRYCEQHGIPSALWCCSIEKDVIEQEIIKKDLRRYRYIFPRESITYNNLLEAGFAPGKVIKVCDPAFSLDLKEVPLPEGFADGNTVGINISPLVVKKDNLNAWNNTVKTAEWILENTDMAICLVPHVYRPENDSQDLKLLRKLRDELNSPRVSIVEENYTCEELKYIISRCRFFIGARTHSTIAAYSTGVPCIVIGYSVKSKGIATDLFGTYRDYVLPYDEQTEANELLAAFRKLMENEERIKDNYRKVLPDYKKQLTDAIEKYIPRYDKIGNLRCTGCSACAEVCPKGCISMQRDEYGFLYPSVDQSRCIHCNACFKACPLNKEHGIAGKKKAYCGKSPDDRVRNMSTSGGLFAELAENTIGKGGIVFGAAFSEDFKAVKHTAIERKEDIIKLQGSKYVQSGIGDSFLQAKQELEKGRAVLFTGTPCQINGLNAYLGKEYDDLITCDIICHGVPAPAAYEKYISELEGSACSKPVSVSFRDKTEGWRNYSFKAEFENGAEYRKLNVEDPYLRAFVGNLDLRPSCHVCNAKGINRSSDLTLGDFWGMDKVCPEKNDGKGTSVIFANTEKGLDLIAELRESIDIEEIRYEEATLKNSSYFEAAPRNARADLFMASINGKSFSKSVERAFYVSPVKVAASKVKKTVLKVIK